MARPSKFTAKVAEEICERIADGESLRSICGRTAMPSRMTVLRWLEENELFRGRYARAREFQADYMDDRILEEAAATTNDNAQAQRVKIDAYKWRASKLKPKRYGDKIDVTSGDKPIKELDETAVAARVASLLRTGLERDESR